MKVGVFHPKLNIPLIDDLMESVIRGFQEHESDAFIVRNNIYKECDVAIRWGMHSLKYPETTQYRDTIDRAHEGPIGVIELGWLNDREKMFQFGFGGISGNAKHYCFDQHLNGPDLISQGIFIAEERIKKPDDYILICGQVPWDTSVQHIDYAKWVHQIAWNITYETKLPIIFRPHPKHPRAINIQSLTKDHGVILSDPAKRTLTKDLTGARCTVVFNSNAALESLIHGTPAVTLDKGSMVYTITSNNLDYLDHPHFPRKELLEKQVRYILKCQWSAESFEQNIPWRIAKTRLDVG